MSDYRLINPLVSLMMHIQITATFQFDVFAAVGTQVSTKTDSIVNMDGHILKSRRTATTRSRR